MESMGIIGFVFGIAGLSFSLIVKEQVEQLKKELTVLKKELKK